MIRVSLNHVDLLNLLKSESPKSEFVSELIELRLGNICGGHDQQWRWDMYELGKLTELQLWTLYQKVKHGT